VRRMARKVRFRQQTRSALAMTNKQKRKKSAVSTPLVLVLACEDHVDVLIDGVNIPLSGKPRLHGAASLVLGHALDVTVQAGVGQ